VSPAVVPVADGCCFSDVNLLLLTLGVDEVLLVVVDVVVVGAADIDAI
jgi:hypothetical protein